MKILDPRTIARDIAKAYNLPTVPKPEVIHRFAKLKGFGFKRAGGLRGYAENIKTAIAQDPDGFKRCYQSNPDYDANKYIEPDRTPRFNESRVIEIIKEEIEETVRGVLKANNPNYVDLKTAINNFNKWFKGSKVVEDNGDPLLCYHGTPKGGFTTFNTIEGVDKKTKWQLLFGSHFTNDMEQAKVYMGNTKKKTKMLYTVFLSIKNPLDITYGKSVISKPLTSDEEYALSERPELVDAIKEVIPKRMLNKHRINDRYNECYHLWNLLNDMTPFQARKVVEQLGYDGIKYDARYVSGVYGYNRSERRDVSWIAFYPNQIKSACNNNGMFDPNSDNINE